MHQIYIYNSSSFEEHVRMTRRQITLTLLHLKGATHLILTQNTPNNPDIIDIHHLTPLENKNRSETISMTLRVCEPQQSAH